MTETLSERIFEACKYGPEAVGVVLNEYARWKYYVGDVLEEAEESQDDKRRTD